MGCPKIVRTAAALKAVLARIRRNPVQKQSLMARELNISIRSMFRLLSEHHGFRAYCRSIGYFLTLWLKKQRELRWECVLQRYANNGHRNILFTIEESLNRQNDRVYASSSREAHEIVPEVQRGHYSSSMMVWWGQSYSGATQLHFFVK